MSKNKRIEEAEEIIEFCKSAIEDAIGLEDGLDGGAGEVVIKMIVNYYKEYRPDLYKDHQDWLKQMSKAPVI